MSVVTLSFGVQPDKIKAACEKAGLSAEASAKVESISQVIVDLHVDEDGYITGGVVPDMRKAEQEKKERKPATIENVMAAYRKTRDEEIAALNDQVSKLRAVQAKREAWLAAQLTKDNLDNVKIKGVGMAFFQNTESVTIADKPAFIEWVKEDIENRLDFLETKASKSQVTHMLEEEKVLPPGVNYSTFRKLMVRKA